MVRELFNDYALPRAESQPQAELQHYHKLSMLRERPLKKSATKQYPTSDEDYPSRQDKISEIEKVLENKYGEKFTPLPVVVPNIRRSL
jgi:hypothetical protein